MILVLLENICHNSDTQRLMIAHHTLGISDGITWILETGSGNGGVRKTVSAC